MGSKVVAYHLCPRCARATPAGAGESFCPNDGESMLRACPACGARIVTPFGGYCVACGARLIRSGASREPPREPST